MAKKGSLATVFFVVLIDLMGFGIVLPLMPFYANEFSANPLQVGLLYSVYSLAQLIFSPIWGTFSDRFGRRPIMILSTLGASFSYVIFGLAESYTILFISRLLAGIMGGNISAAQAYIADVTDEKSRASGMGLIGAAFGIGFVIGPALSTGLLHPSFPILLENFGLAGVSEFVAVHKYAVPGYVAAILSFASFLMVLGKLPETVDTSNQKESSVRRGVFRKEFWLNFLPSHSGNILLTLLFAVSLLVWIGQGTLYSAFPLFCEEVLGMTAVDVGIQFFYLGVVSAVIQGGLIRPLTARFSEESIFAWGIVFTFSGMFGFVFVDSVSTLTLSLVGLAIGNSLSLPTLNSLISKQCSPSELGAMLGTAQSIAGLGRVLGPTWGGWLFVFGPSIPFFATSLLVAPAILIAVRIWRKRS